MAPHGLIPQDFFQGALGEHCVNLVMDEFSQNMFDLLTFFQIDAVFVRNAG